MNNWILKHYKCIFIFFVIYVFTIGQIKSESVFDSNTSALQWPGNAPSELGMRFRTLVGGTITGVRFYKVNDDTGNHTGTLWSGSGAELASVTFSNESASGWQEASFASEVTIEANTEYVISYHNSSGRYAYFGQPSLPYSNGFITGLKSVNLMSVNEPTFPTNNSSNHLVDIVFSPNATSGSGDTSSAITIFGDSIAPQFHWPGNTPTELGLRFKSTEAGNVVGVRFYKGNNDTGGHLASLWDLNGNQLANVAFVNETETGWQETLFTSPVPIQANQEYVVSYHSASGRYAYRMSPSYPLNNSSLTGLKGHKSDANTSTFPVNTSGFIYMVDVLFEADPSGGSQNILPVASFNTSSIQGNIPFTVSFDASNSTDSDGSIVTYNWDFGDGHAGQGVQASHIYSEDGTFIAILTVTDDQGGEATKEIQIIAEEATPKPNVKPIASFTASTQSGTVSFPVVFNAIASNDTDGTIESYHWDFGDGTTGTSKLTSHFYTTPGEYTVTLTVTDDDQATATHQLNISANAKPNAKMNLSPATGGAPLTVQFDAAETTDQDGSISTYTWDFGDGTTGQGLTTSHIYTAQGSFFPKLTVIDDDGAQDIDVATVVVNPSNQAPVAQFTATPGSGNAPLTVQFDASGSSDSDGNIDAYQWDFGDGSMGQGIAKSHVFSTPGEYLVKLTVTDDDGAIKATNHQIKVSVAAPLIITPNTITSNQNITLSGQSTANSTVQIYVNSNSSITTTADDTGLFSALLTLVEGEQQIYATAELNGLLSEPSNTISVTYSENQPVTLPASNIDPSNDPLTGEVYKGKLVGTQRVEKDGSFSYHIPIEVAPGINGMQPDLALSYNSNTKNGLLGVGWSLAGLSSISRCPASLIRDGYVSGINTTDSYKFCLDGQRLIEVSENEFRTEVEQFSKIQKIDDYWVVTKKDGTKYRYGYTSNARQLDDSEATFTWMVDEIRDVSNNYLTVLYEKESGDIIYEPPISWTSSRPSQIEYTKNDTAGGINQTVEFGYEQRLDDTQLHGFISGKVIWEKKRLKQIVVKSNGNQVRNYNLDYQVPGQFYQGEEFDDPTRVSRIASITLCYENYSNCAKPTTFEWEEAKSSIVVDNNSYLNIPDGVFFADYDGDGKTDALSMGFSTGQIPEGEVRIVYGTVIISDEVDAISAHEGLVEKLYSGAFTVLRNETQPTIPYEHCVNGVCTSETFKSRKSLGVADFNADGLMDYFIKDDFNGDGIRVFLSSENRTFTQSIEYTLVQESVVWNGVFQELVTNNGSYEFNRPYGIIFQDFNGDGLVDALRYKNISHQRPDSSVSGASELLPGNCYFSAASIGKYHCVAYSNDESFNIEVALNNGGGFGDFTLWGSGAYLARQFTDVNGDNLLDLVGSADDPNIVRGVAINKGDKFVYNNEEWGIKTSATSPYAEHYKDRLMGDFNGDGMTDFLSVQYGDIGVHLSTGKGFTTWINWAGQSLYSQLTATHGNVCWWSVLDINTDGRADLINSCSQEVMFSRGAHFTSPKAVFGDPQAFIEEKIHYSIAHPQATPRSLLRGASDLNHDGKIDYLGINTLSNHRILGIDVAGENQIRIKYTVFGQSAQYQAESQGFYSNNFVNSITTASVAGGEPISSGFLDSIFDIQKGQHGVSSLAVSNGIGGWVKTEYHYRGAKKHLAGYGNLGFSEVTETEWHVSQNNNAIFSKKINEYSQEISAEYNLAGTLLKGTTYIANEQGVLTKTSEVNNRWQTRIYNDDIDSDYDSPHYHPYLVYSNAIMFDLNTGLQTGREINKFGYNTSDKSTCEATQSYANTITSDTFFYPEGLAREVVIIKCNAYGVSGSVTRNLGVQPFYAYGLPKKRITEYWSPKNNGAVDTRTQTVDYSYNTLGQITSQTIEAQSGADISLTTDYQYNSFGSVSTITESWVNTAENGLAFTDRETKITEKYLGEYKEITTTNALGQADVQWFDLTHGNNIKSLNINNQETSRNFDTLGRLNTKIEPNNIITQFDYRTCDFCIPLNVNAIRYRQVKKSGFAASRQYFDVFSRDVVTRTKGLTGEYNYTFSEYDALGRLRRTVKPFRAGEAQQSTWFKYDYLNRIIKTTFPNNSTQINNYTAIQNVGDYASLTAISTDSLGRSQQKIMDTEGKTRQILDALNTSIYYFYDPLGNLTEVELEGHKQIITYDQRSRKIQLNDPDTGVVDYKYNPLGLVSEEKNAKGEVTRYHYDALGRVIKRVDNALGTATTHHFAYDAMNGIGLPAGVSGVDTDGKMYSKQYQYNTLSLMQRVDTKIDATNYTDSFHYDDFNRPISRVWPTGFTSQTLFSVHNGQVAQINNAADNVALWRASLDDAQGNLTEVVLGNGLVEKKSYFADTGLIDSIAVRGSEYVAMDQRYTWDTEGNLTSRSDYRNPSEIVSQYFCYDSLNRIKIVDNNACTNTNNNDTSVNFQYDLKGNITKKEEVSYSYGTRPHAVTQAGSAVYNYDAAGNMINGNNRAITYTVFGKPKRITKGSHAVQITYGSDKSRIQRKDISTGVTRTITYVNGDYEQEQTASAIRHLHYINTPSGTIGLYIQIESATENSSKMLYHHTDHLGSIVAKTDDQGDLMNSTELLAYDVWGQRLEESWEGFNAGETYQTEGNPRGYTNHEHLDSVGLIHMNGRAYDPVLGRFISPDPIIQDPYNTQSFNRYSYVWNNPMRYTDPTGYQTEGVAYDSGAPSYFDFDSAQQNYSFFGERDAGANKRGYSLTSSVSGFVSSSTSSLSSLGNDPIMKRPCGGMHCSISDKLEVGDFVTSSKIEGTFFGIEGRHYYRILVGVCKKCTEREVYNVYNGFDTPGNEEDLGSGDKLLRNPPLFNWWLPNLFIDSTQPITHEENAIYMRTRNKTLPDHIFSGTVNFVVFTNPKKVRVLSIIGDGDGLAPLTNNTQGVNLFLGETALPTYRYFNPNEPVRSFRQVNSDFITNPFPLPSEREDK